MTVILVDPRHPSMVPVEAVALLAGDLQYTEELPVRLAWSLSTARPVYIGEDAPALLSSDPDHPEVRARVKAGAAVIAPPARQGEKLIDAVAVMDRLADERAVGEHSDARFVASVSARGDLRAF